MIPIIRYLFIHDGQQDASLRDGLIRQLKELDSGVEYDFYAASGADDVLRHVSLYCDLHPGLDTCFVACGGDPITSGVAAGLMGADAGKSMAIYDPSGANALARYYEGRDFGSIAMLLAGSETGIDMIRVNDTYAVNACTSGLEDLTDAAGGLFRSLSTVLRRTFRSVRVTADNVPLDTGSILLMTLANGRFAPGGLPCAPQAVNDDGKLDLCIVRNMPPTRLSKFVQQFAAGTIADDPSLTGDLILRRVRTLTVESAKEMTFRLDGRPITDRSFSIKVIPAAVRLRIPAV